MLFQQFQQFIKQQELVNSSDKLLVAVSGGVDSMVLLHLCHQAGYQIAVAHVNFKLRGAASDNDENLVIETCKQLGIDCFTKSFNTLTFANNNKLSIQMAARELRYNYFNELILQHQFSKLLTAHHANDQAETFFINLLRNSGIQGLTGIPLQNNYIIRPLLFATKNTIENYAQNHHIKFNTDSSNFKDDYVRNQIRHHVIPSLEKTGSNALHQILNSMQHLQDDNKLLQELHQKAMTPLLSEHEFGTKINVTLLQQYQNASQLLFWHVKNYGFNKTQVLDMLDHHKNESGRLFKSATHQIVHNRSELILSKIATPATTFSISIANIHQNIDSPVNIQMQAMAIEHAAYKQAAAHEAFLDLAKVQFPLLLRSWQQGDSMQPLGMSHHKKISDILIDAKVDILAKGNTYVLCNANKEIIWLLGHRLSESVKVDSKTEQVLYLKFTQ